jgi:hypothetical protein
MFPPDGNPPLGRRRVPHGIEGEKVMSEKNLSFERGAPLGLPSSELE